MKLFLLLLAPLLLLGCGGSAEKNETVKMPTVEVQTQILEQVDVPFQVEVAGTVKAVEHALISSRVAGQVSRLPVEVGSRVNKGDLLVAISADEIKAKLRQAETRLAQARRNLERESKLLPAGASTAERVNTLEEQVQIAAAGEREVRAMLEYTRVRAPFNSTVTRKLIEVGDLATPGAPLLQLENSKALEVQIQVPGALAQGLKLEDPLPISIPAAGLDLDARIREIEPTVDPETRTTRIKLTLPARAGLRSGQFARVSLVDRRAKTLLVPAEAISVNGQMDQVFVVEDGTAHLRLVRVGTRHGEQVEILSGLTAGDQVIIHAATQLHDGQPLKIVAPEPLQ